MSEHEDTVVAPPKNITEALARIMAELPAIAKKRHPEGGVTYAFRGIEEITAEAQELCARYGVVYFPRGEITEIKEITVNGKPWTDTIVSVEYEVSHGPSDTSKIVRVPGIGRDNSDKGSNKGMTQAFKYALIQTLMVADPKDDGDRERHETESRGSRRSGKQTENGQPRQSAPNAVNGNRSEAADTSPAGGSLDSMSLRELAAECARLGLPTSGGSAGMRQRLLEHAAPADTAESQEPVQACCVCGSTEGVKPYDDGNLYCADDYPF